MYQIQQLRYIPEYIYLGVKFNLIWVKQVKGKAPR